MGDLDAYEVLVARYTAVAHRTAYLLGAGDAAEDVVQEAFVKAYRGLGRFRVGEPFRPWLLRIVVNETRNLRRSGSRRAAAAAAAAAAAVVLAVGITVAASPQVRADRAAGTGDR